MAQSDNRPGPSRRLCQSKPVEGLLYEPKLVK